MKKILLIPLILILSLILTGCEVESSELPQKINKKVIDKKDTIENRLSGTDFILGTGSITKSQSVYYLFSEDGMLCEVDLKTYMNIKIEDEPMFECYWE